MGHAHTQFKRKSEVNPYMKELKIFLGISEQAVFSFLRVLSGKERRPWAFTRNFAVSITISSWENELHISANRHVLPRWLKLYLKSS